MLSRQLCPSSSIRMGELYLGLVSRSLHQRQAYSTSPNLFMSSTNGDTFREDDARYVVYNIEMSVPQCLSTSDVPSCQAGRSPA